MIRIVALIITLQFVTVSAFAADASDQGTRDKAQSVFDQVDKVFGNRPVTNAEPANDGEGARSRNKGITAPAEAKGLRKFRVALNSSNLRHSKAMQGNSRVEATLRCANENCADAKILAEKLKSAYDGELSTAKDDTPARSKNLSGQSVAVISVPATNAADQILLQLTCSGSCADLRDIADQVADTVTGTVLAVDLSGAPARQVITPSEPSEKGFKSAGSTRGYQHQQLDTICTDYGISEEGCKKIDEKAELLKGEGVTNQSCDAIGLNQSDCDHIGWVFSIPKCVSFMEKVSYGDVALCHDFDFYLSSKEMSGFLTEMATEKQNDIKAHEYLNNLYKK